ncbi:hypothetical protein FGB62_20g211 [Gracilaria domingensis]|nr:hypothetical protein FGB62_20g211 [Gracilaria domingensis]
MVNARRSSRRTTTTGTASQSSEQIIPGVEVDLLVVLENGAKEVVGHATMFNDNGSLKTSLHGSELEAGCVVIYLTEITGDGTLPYPYTFGGVEGPPATLDDILRAGTYAWDREMLRPRSAPQREDPQPATAEAQPASVAGPAEPEPQHDSTAELGNVKENIHVISSSDEDVVEVKRPKRTETNRKKNILDFNVSSIDLTDYTQRAVTIDITRIKKPEQTLRGMSEIHKGDLIENFRKRGLLGALGLMSVTVAREIDMKNALNDEDRVLVDCVLVDGHHRLMALLHILEHDKDPRWKTITKSVRVMLWRRTDGQHVTASEVLRLGAVLNEESEALLKMRFADKVHSTVSLIKILECEHSICASELESEQVAQCLQSSNLISGAERKQYVRYADIALKLASTPGMVEKFEHMCEHNSKRVLTHFSYTELYKLDADEFWFAMECIRRLVVKDPKTYAWGRFEDVRTFFFDRELAMYRAARTVGAEKKLILEDFFKEAFRISGDTGPLIPVSEFVFGQAVNMRVLPRRAVREESIQRSANMVRNRLRSFFGIQTPTASKKKPGSGSAQPPSSKTTKNKEQTDDDDGSVVDLEGGAGPPGVRRSQRVAAKSSTNSAAGKGGLQKRVKAKGGSVDPLQEIEKEMESDGEIQASQPPRKKRKLFLPSKLVDLFQRMDVDDLMREMNEKTMSKKGVVLMVLEEDEDAFLDDEEMEESEAESRLGFDDENPEELPEEESLLEKGKPHDGGEYPAWCNLTVVCPRRREGQNHIANREPWLRANHMAGGHRSELLSEGDLRSVHYAVYWHASRARHQELGTTKGPVLGFPLPTNRPAGTSDENALWLAAVERDEVLYTGRICHRCDHPGYGGALDEKGFW